MASRKRRGRRGSGNGGGSDDTRSDSALFPDLDTAAPGALAGHTAGGPLQSDMNDRARQALEVVQQLQTDFAARDRLYERYELVVFQDQAVNIPDNYRATALEVRSPMATMMANTIVAALSVNRPTVHFQPIGLGGGAQRNSTLREHFFQASWQRQEEEARRRIFRAFMWSLVVKGEAIMKTIERSKRAWSAYDAYQEDLSARLDDPDDEEYGEVARGGDGDARKRIFQEKADEFKRAAAYPIASTDVPPETFKYLKGEDGFTFISEIKDVPWYEALDRYQAGIDREGRIVNKVGKTNARVSGYMESAPLGSHEWGRVMQHNGASALRMFEVWTWDECLYLLSGPGQWGGKDRIDVGSATIVKRVGHRYGNPELKTLRGPYSHALGLTTASRLPEKAGLSVLFPFLELFPLLDSLLTIQGNAAFLTGYPSFKRVGPPSGALPARPRFGADGSETEGQETKITPGTIYPWDVQAIDQPRSGVALDKMIAGIGQMLEMGFPPAARGQLEGDPSGYAFNQAAYTAKLGWTPLTDNAEFALSERMQFESWLIEECISEPVYVWGSEPVGPGRKANKYGWLSLGPDELNGNHRYNVKLDAETPSNKVVEVRAQGELLKLRLTSPQRATEDVGNNADEIEYDWLIYDLKNDPRTKKTLFDKVFEALGGLDREKAEKATAEEAAAGGPPGPPGAGATGAPPGSPGAGSSLGAVGQVYTPGQGMPITPTPGGARTGAFPGNVGGARTGAFPGNVGAAPGNPVVPRPPAAALPLQGQQ